MEDNQIENFEAEEALEPQIDSSETCDFPQTLVTEKIIFVIDLLLTESENEDDVLLVTRLTEACKSYFLLKQKYCVKPAEFEVILFNNKAISHSQVHTVKDINTAFLEIRCLVHEEETEPLKLDRLFDKIASLVELPDPDCSKKCLPPNWLYHVICILGQNLYVPTMENTNSFNFLMMTPYFALDILYLYNDHLQDNQCKDITQALASLNVNGKGYFIAHKQKFSKEQLFSCFAQFLGHPLIRPPQRFARFNIFQLDPDNEVENDNEN